MESQSYVRTGEAVMEGLTVEQAAQELGYKPMTIYQKIGAGKIRVRRSGRRLRIFEEDNGELFLERRAFLGRDDGEG